jgi:hypothetical protein
MKMGSDKVIRHCPHLPLPQYRYVPGTRPKEEHRKDLPRLKFENQSPEDWRKNEPYLYGIDLYHEGFYYEAHEVWEELWHRVGHHSPQGQFLKALIQLAAAQLKRKMNDERPTRRLLVSLTKILRTLSSASQGETWMGLNLKKLIQACDEKAFDKMVEIRLELTG